MFLGTVMFYFLLYYTFKAHFWEVDINLPDGNGFDFLIEIKEKYDTPVIMLTANDLESAFYEDPLNYIDNASALCYNLSNKFRTSDIRLRVPLGILYWAIRR